MITISPRVQKIGIIAGAISLPLVLFFIFFVTSGQDGAYKDQESLVHTRAVNAATHISSLLSGKLSALEHIGFIYNELSQTDKTGSNEVIQHFVASESDMMDVAVVDNRGKEVIRKSAGTNSKSGFADRSQNIEFLAVKQKGYYIGPVYLSQGKPLFLMGRAIYSTEAKIMRGAVFALFAADMLLDQLKDTSGQNGTSVFIVNEKGIITAHPTFSYMSEQKDASRNPSVQLAMAGNGILAQTYRNELTEKVVGSAVPLTITSDARTQISTGWFVIMETPASIVFAAALRQRNFVAFGLIALFFLSVAGLWIMLRMMRGPVMAVGRALQEISAGNFTYRLPVPDNDEWKRISKGVNTVADMLARASSDLVQERMTVSAERGKLALALSEISDAVIACDQNGIIILTNKPAQDLIGCSADAIAGKHIDRVVRLFENDKPLLVSEYYSQAEKNGLTRMGNSNGLRLITSENHERLVLARIGAFAKEESTHHGGYVIAIHDISHERFLEKVKADFVLIAAHELRTPLTEVKWAIDILMGKELGVLSRKQKNLLKRSFDSNEHMIQLVDDLLNTATIESAQSHYHKAPCDIKKLVSDIIAVRKKVAEKKGIILTFKKSKTQMPLISVDQAAIKIAVNNLLDNALAYTPKDGRVTVSVAQTDSVLEVHVADTGIGISTEDNDRVFLKFFRGKDAMKMTTSGAGLGLYIAKKIIEAHGGSVWVQSQPNIGSTFGVSLPV